MILSILPQSLHTRQKKNEPRLLAWLQINLYGQCRALGDNTPSQPRAICSDTAANTWRSMVQESSATLINMPVADFPVWDAVESVPHNIYSNSLALHAELNGLTLLAVLVLIVYSMFNADVRRRGTFYI